MRNLILLTIVVLVVGSLAAFAQDVEPSKGFRANRTTYSPRMDMLASSSASPDIKTSKLLVASGRASRLAFPDAQALPSFCADMPGNVNELADVI